MAEEQDKAGEAGGEGDAPAPVGWREGGRLYYSIVRPFEPGLTRDEAEARLLDHWREGRIVAKENSRLPGDLTPPADWTNAGGVTLLAFDARSPGYRDQCFVDAVEIRRVAEADAAASAERGTR